MPESTNPPRLLRLRAVIERTGLTRSSIYRQIADNTFPGSINIGPRSVAWRSTDIEDWVAARAEAPHIDAAAGARAKRRENIEARPNETA